MQIDYPTARTAPADLTARLGEIDPTARLVYVGAGEWSLWFLPDDAERQMHHHGAGVASYRAMEDFQGLRGARVNARRLLTAALQLRGYEWEADYEFQGEPTGLIVEHFRARRWAQERLTEAQLDHLIADACGDTAAADRAKKLADAIASEARSLDAIIHRKRVSVVKPTMRVA